MKKIPRKIYRFCFIFGFWATFRIWSKNLRQVCENSILPEDCETQKNPKKTIIFSTSDFEQNILTIGRKKLLCCQSSLVQSQRKIFKTFDVTIQVYLIELQAMSLDSVQTFDSVLKTTFYEPTGMFCRESEKNHSSVSSGSWPVFLEMFDSENIGRFSKIAFFVSRWAFLNKKSSWRSW